MAQCTPRYLPLCSIPQRMMRDGWAGVNAKIYVPFCGFVFASGATLSLASATVEQDQATFIGGVSRTVDTFQKNGCSC